MNAELQKYVFAARGTSSPKIESPDLINPANKARRDAKKEAQKIFACTSTFVFAARGTSSPRIELPALNCPSRGEMLPADACSISGVLARVARLPVPIHASRKSQPALPPRPILRKTTSTAVSR